MQTCSGFDSDQASSSSKARTSYRGRPATVRQASPRAPARLRGSSSPLLACLIPTDLAPVPVPSSAAPGRTHMHAGCTGEELSFSTEPSVLDWDLTSLVVYSSHQALSSLFFLSGGIVYAGQYERAGSSGGGVVPQFVVHTWHCPSIQCPLKTSFPVFCCRFFFILIFRSRLHICFQYMFSQKPISYIHEEIQCIIPLVCFLIPF